MICDIDSDKNSLKGYSGEVAQHNGWFLKCDYGWNRYLNLAQQYSIS